VIRRILALFRRANHIEAAAPCISRDVLIARRASRLHNRNREGAARFERVHSILSRSE
jgi:hypothetical protein